MRNKTKALLLEIPAILLLLVCLVGTFYVKISGVYPTTWATPITILIIVILFFLGKIFETKARNNPYF